MPLTGQRLHFVPAERNPGSTFQHSGLRPFQFWSDRGLRKFKRYSDADNTGSRHTVLWISIDCRTGHRTKSSESRYTRVVSLFSFRVKLINGKG